MTRVGFIGLGQLGQPMARRLLEAGYELTVHNRSREIVATFAGLGARAAASPIEVARHADVILTALPLPGTVREVYLGPGGLVEACGPEHICIDHSTVAPELSGEIGRALAGRGAALLDAPVSGGPEAAAIGQLAIMVGGPRPAFDQARSLLAVLGRRVEHCGPNGAGSVVKLINQVLVGVHSVAAGEAIALAERTGVDPWLALELAGAGLGGSAILKRNGPRILQGDFAPGARLETYLKDTGLVRELCDNLGLELPVFFRAKQSFETAFEMGAGRLDLAAVVCTIRPTSPSWGAARPESRVVGAAEAFD